MEKDLEHIQQVLTPMKAFQSKLRKKLFATFVNRRLHSFFTSVTIRSMQMRRILIGLLIVLVLLGGGLSVYAYESPDVTNGHPLYGLKRTMEQVEGLFATTDESQAEYHLKMALRRIDEEHVLASQGTEDPQTLKEINQEIDSTLEKFNNIKDESVRTKVMALYKNGLHKKIEALIDNGDIETGSGSTILNNQNNNGYKNYGQERSSFVNKGQQGDRMRSEQAHNRLRLKLEDKIKDVKEENDNENENINLNINISITNQNSNFRNYGQEHSSEVNKGQKGEEEKIEHANEQANMNVKVQDTYNLNINDNDNESKDLEQDREDKHETN